MTQGPTGGCGPTADPLDRAGEEALRTEIARLEDENRALRRATSQVQALIDQRERAAGDRTQIFGRARAQNSITVGRAAGGAQTMMSSITTQ